MKLYTLTFLTVPRGYLQHAAQTDAVTVAAWLAAQGTGAAA
jgi:hypothetical protein